MRLVLVHGIEQQGKSSLLVREEWLSALREALGPKRFDGMDIDVPFYGNLLAGYAGTETVLHVVEQGVSSDDEERVFLESGLEEIARAQGLTNADIDAQREDHVVSQGLPHDRRLIAIARAIEHVSPLHGGLALRILKQAFVYLMDVRTADAVDDVVRPVLLKGPCVVVAHSLGSIVTFKLLREQEHDVPLYVTLGSPLALHSVRKALGRPRTVPDGVQRWLNGVDINDFVTLGQGLAPATEYSAEIENLLDLDNGSDAHDIGQYLRDKRICKKISDAL